MRNVTVVILLFFISAACSLPLFNSPKDTEPRRTISPTAQGTGTTLALKTPAPGYPSVTPQPSRPPVKANTPISGKKPTFGPMKVCEQVTEKGECINPRKSFPAGTMQVDVVWDYQNIQKGMTWALVMERDGVRLSGSDPEPWDHFEDGWVSYTIIEELSYNPLGGHYVFTLYIGDEAVQRSEIDVELPKIERSRFPAFGPVQFAQDVTDEGEPIEPNNTFNYGTKIVYGVFPFTNMEPGIPFSRVWLQNGKEVARRDLSWDDDREGMTYASLEDKDGLSPGTYTLNLYINQQVARSGNFTVLAPPQPRATPTRTPLPPARPEEVIDSKLLPIWTMLANDTSKSSNGVRTLANYVLKHRIKMYVDPKYSGYAAFSYQCIDPPPKVVGEYGEIRVSQKTFQESEKLDLAGALLHELTHAMQFGGEFDYVKTRCGCSLIKEHYAFISQSGYYVSWGRDELMYGWLGKDLYDANGKFSFNKLYSVVKQLYGDRCVEY